MHGGPLDDLDVLWPGNESTLIITTNKQVDGTNVAVWHRYDDHGDYHGIQTRRWEHIG